MDLAFSLNRKWIWSKAKIFGRKTGAYVWLPWLHYSNNFNQFRERCKIFCVL